MAHRHRSRRGPAYQLVTAAGFRNRRSRTYGHRPPVIHFRSGDLIDNLVYAVIFFSIATTALLVFLFEKTGLSGVFSGWWFREVLADQDRADAEGSSPVGLQSVSGKDQSSSPEQNDDLL